MAAEQQSTGVDGFTVFDASAWMPVYGEWCGPGWSAGQRNPNITIQQMLDSPVLMLPGGQASVIDTICKAHDIAYAKAAGQPNEAYLIAEADRALLEALREVDFKSLPEQESGYATFMAFAFYHKLMIIDWPRAGVEALWEKIKSLTAWVAGMLDRLNGLTYTDIFGNTIVGTSFSGNVEGLAYVIKGVTGTRLGGRTATFTHYKDGYQDLYSGVDSAYDPNAGAVLKVWVDGTITLIEGLRQIQLTSPSATGVPQPLAGSFVNPVPGAGKDPNAARFFWNGFYVFDGTRWSKKASGEFDAWVCVSNECVAVPKMAR
ncbi:MAG: hypothetical protein J0I68_05155 [Achromobacter sp.]|jgi:hypothetical protein|uniref:Uncharacterized protein n=1 Tax=Achromobacter insuavis TaxID=1287735 RepID=A0A6J4ZM05_9BURK|nr:MULTISPECIES: hypothetical protein [Achromobacter]MBN9637900.1 hypothetical protein [Achromobacter sp.]CAB3636186.1 hypothetical protein LMG26845_01682 [Achromobacter insuavis]CUI67334.1 Uncharacterised protein [Achromobacter sp. 2789STDY5608628]CUI80094.1 Uncharacterised protein [Achromobacter sp. 2789STDY5608633]